MNGRDSTCILWADSMLGKPATSWASLMRTLTRWVPFRRWRNRPGEVILLTQTIQLETVQAEFKPKQSDTQIILCFPAVLLITDPSAKWPLAQSQAKPTILIFFQVVRTWRDQTRWLPLGSWLLLELEEGWEELASSEARWSSMGQPMSSPHGPVLLETKLSKNPPTQTPSETARLMSLLLGEVCILRSGSPSCGFTSCHAVPLPVAP